jgi:hypothetical protein
MKDTAMNAIPNNGTMNFTGFPCYELYVTKSLFLTECSYDSIYPGGGGHDFESNSFDQESQN